MLAKDILRIVLYGVGLSSLGAVIYFAGPFIAFGDWRPLENHIVRQIAILLLTTIVAGIVGLNLFKRRKNAKEIAAALGLSSETVRTHFRNIYRALQVHCLNQALDRTFPSAR